jgi:hypothetical protein
METQLFQCRQCSRYLPVDNFGTISSKFTPYREGDQYKTCERCRYARKYGITQANELYNYKREETPHYLDIKNQKILRLSFTYRGTKYSKNMGYARKGYDAVRAQLEKHFEIEMERLNRNTVANITGYTCEKNKEQITQREK